MIESLGDDGDVDACAAAGGQVPRAGAERINRSWTAAASLTLSSRGPVSSCRWRLTSSWRSSLRSCRRLLRDPGIVRSDQDEDAQRHTPRRSKRTRPP